MTMQRKRGERSSGGLYSSGCMQIAYPTLRKLKRVIVNLGPLSNQHALVGFLRNIENAKTLTGFVQDLANAIMDYQV